VITVPKNETAKRETPCLAMRPREAAQAIGISERLLWEWTNRGLVPHVRLGKAILYPVDSLREWLKKQAKSTKAAGIEKAVHPVNA